MKLFVTLRLVALQQQVSVCRQIKLQERFASLWGGAVTGTSANKTGYSAATSASEALSQLEGSPLDLILDGGSTLSNTPSTVIDCTNDVPTILRHGAISVSSLEQVLGKGVKFNEGS